MNSKPSEKQFRKKVINELKKIRGLYFFSKEACAIRGISDIIGCTPSGRFFAWEIKRSKDEVYFKTKDGIKLGGRTSLQWYNIKRIRESNGIAQFVYPENLLECLDEVND